MSAVDSYLLAIYGFNYLPVGRGDRSIPTTNSGDTTEYFLNTHGHRAEEPSYGNTSVIIAGCSVTYGVGVPEKYRWGDLLTQDLKLDSYTVARPGLSVFEIVFEIVSYIEKYGKPKYILCLFPGSDRIAIPIDGKILRSTGSLYEPANMTDTYNHNGSHIAMLQTASLQEYYSDTKILKKPFDVGAVISIDIAKYYSVRAVKFLESFSKALGIKLVWSTWDTGFSEELNGLSSSGYSFESYVDISKLENCQGSHAFLECDCSLSCHKDLEELVGEVVFRHGLDLANGIEHSHPGVHFHRHVADAFLSSFS